MEGTQKQIATMAIANRTMVNFLFDHVFFIIGYPILKFYSLNYYRKLLIVGSIFLPISSMSSVMVLTKGLIYSFISSSSE